MPTPEAAPAVDTIGAVASDDLGLLADLAAPVAAPDHTHELPPQSGHLPLPLPCIICGEMLGPDEWAGNAPPWGHVHMGSFPGSLDVPNARCVVVPRFEHTPIELAPSTSAEPHPDQALSADEVLGMVPWTELVRVHQATRQILCPSTPTAPLRAQMAALIEYYAPELSLRARELAAELIAEVGQ